jgi:hypothetical protein
MTGAVMQGRAESDNVSSRRAIVRSYPLQLLRDRQAGSIEHLNGNLLDHLERTERLLLNWDATSVLATAGLCHAAYGTDGFAPFLLGLDERDVLTSAVGSDVEAIVYFYGSCDRSFLYPQIGRGESTTFRDRFTGEVSSPSMEQLRAFADLTLANEADVALRDMASTSAPAWFIALVHKFEPLASREVADGCEQFISSVGWSSSEAHVPGTPSP